MGNYSNGMIREKRMGHILDNVTRPAGSMLKECSPDIWVSGLRENLVVGDVSSEIRLLEPLKTLKSR